jgi:UDP:flavonoid glycosyltransferase YjiC (YdhE family)
VRVLITVNNAYGHVLPLVPIAQELVRRGHELMVACPGGVADSIGAFGTSVSRYDPVEVPLPSAGPPRSRYAERFTWSVTTSWPNVARGWAAKLLDDARAWRPDVVVCEPLEHAGRLVAAALDLPLVEHGWGFSLPAGSDGKAMAGLADLYGSVGATARAPTLRVDPGPAGVQAPDVDPSVRRYRFVPWAPPAQPLPPPGPDPRVLLTLGTFPNAHAAQRLRTAAAAAGDLGVDLVVVLGHDDRGDAAGWPAGARVEKWVNLAAEITGCALVIHHGGAGTTWAALSAGVPAVCLPQGADQFRNGSLVASAGAAVVVHPDAADLPTLRRVFAAALADPALAGSAGRVRHANEALPDRAVAAAWIESLDWQ